MSKGEIAQVGAPREIYRAPKTRFVAEFVGRNNILTGRVIGFDAGSLTVETAIGQFIVPGDAVQNQEVAIVIAADMVQIGASENSIAATVLSEEFVGSMVTVFLEAADGTELKVQLQERSLGDLDLRAGTSVTLGWNTADSHLLIEGNP